MRILISSFCINTYSLVCTYVRRLLCCYVFQPTPYITTDTVLGGGDDIDELEQELSQLTLSEKPPVVPSKSSF